ncbi:MAG TPA: alpha/beta hydrolase [Polyangiaceae bacterium]|jgi:pimeloyl-ACP methyl ester carboxylesterase|nr:alpha/beta hydrolase [Polyangiaceae bacterium]
MATDIESRRIAEVDVTIGGALAAPVLCAAHPADEFGADTVALLREASAASVVTVNPRGATLEAMVECIERVRLELGVGAWTFWGMSGGGWLGQIYARKHPEVLTGLVLESICGCFRARLADPECVLSPFHPAWRAMLEEHGLLANESHDAVGDPDDTEWMSIGEASVFRRRRGPALVVSPMPLSPAMRERMPLFWAVDHRAWLPEVRVPTLVISGTADNVVPIAHARALHEAIAGSELVVVDNGGHVPVSEHRPEVGEAVRHLLLRLTVRTTV